MRSHENRVAETKRRIAKIEREKRLRRNTITMAFAVAACLVLLIGASLATPGIAASIQTEDMPESSAPTNVTSNCSRFSISSMRILAFPALSVLPVHLPQPEAQNGHAHAE